MPASTILSLSVILVFSNVLGIGVLSGYVAYLTKQKWLQPLIAILAFGEVYCLSFLCTPLSGRLKIEFLERLPYEVGMLLGLGLLWMQWMLQVMLYWRRRRHSPMMQLILTFLSVGQVLNLFTIGVLFIRTPTMVIIQNGWSNSPTTYNSEWVFELGWLTYFSLWFITPLLIVSIKSSPKFWQVRHWIAGLSSFGMIGWWIYWLNCADVVQVLPSS